MWGVAILIYTSLKVLSWLSRRSPWQSLWKEVAYLFAWPGMDADAFLTPGRIPVSTPSVAEWSFAASKMLVGIGLIVTSINSVGWTSAEVSGWMGMLGIVFVLHFGLFHVLSCVWRRCGLLAKPIMNFPIASSSLSEFWGRRWNLAFRDLTHRYLFKPLIRNVSASIALMLAFVVSGLVHDIVISIPSSGGYGGPTIYFLGQVLGILIEKSAVGSTLSLDRGIIGRTFTFLWLIVPLPLLFHRPFVVDVIIPFMKAIGGVL